MEILDDSPGYVTTFCKHEPRPDTWDTPESVLVAVVIVLVAIAVFLASKSVLITVVAVVVVVGSGCV